MRKKISEMTAEHIGIPKEILMNIPKISIAGNKEIFLENYTGIIEYTDQIIRIRAKEYIIKIEGQNLKIINIDSDNLLADGKLDNISFDVF